MTKNDMLSVLETSEDEDAGSDEDSAGTEEDFKQILGITEKNKTWWVKFELTNSEVLEGPIKTIKEDAKTLGFEKELDDYAKANGIDLGKAPPFKKKPAVKPPKKTTTATTAKTKTTTAPTAKIKTPTATTPKKKSRRSKHVCSMDHNKVTNYSPESDKRCFNGKWETHFNVACKECGKLFGEKEEENFVVPTSRSPVYIYNGNKSYDCKIGLCHEHYVALTLKQDGKQRHRSARNN